MNMIMGNKNGDDQHKQLTNDRRPQQLQTEDTSVNPTSRLHSHEALRDKYSAQNVNKSETELSKWKWKKRGAVRMAGFMFWTNFAGVIFLFVGFVSPGWLTVKAYQYLETYSSRYRKIYVYQDYSLWYITQCYDPGTGTVCQTVTYRLIDSLFEKPCDSSSCDKMEFGSLIKTDISSLLFFADAALVFSYTEIVRTEALYTIGLLLALSTLFVWHMFRRNVAKDKPTSLSTKKWVLLFLFSILSTTFVFVPVATYTGMSGTVGGYSRESLISPVGIVFAEFGGAMMSLCSAAVLMHVLCCRNMVNVYICSCGEGKEAIQGPQEEVDV